MALDLGVPEPPRWLLVCALVILGLGSWGCASTDQEATRLAPTYADILVRELRTDREVLVEVRDSLIVEQSLASLWIDWIDEEEVTASHTLMEGVRNLARPETLALRRRVVGEIERHGHWAAIPEPALREDLARYHALAMDFGDLGRDEVRILREHVSAVLDPEEWVWMFDLPHDEETLSVQFRDSVRLFWNPEFRTVMRMMALSLAERRALVDEIVTLNTDLEDRVRAWRDAD